jgi:glutamate synthase domain-containing protein 2
MIITAPILSPFAVKIFQTVSYVWLCVFIVFIIAAITVVILYFTDKYHSTSTLRRNYPVIARFRYLFEHMGVFLRQYFFADDRQELPFNRAERSWIYRSSKNIDSNIPFGSSLDIHKIGTALFVNSAFPTLETEALKTSAITIGPYCKNPYTTTSVLNISAMSYGSISVPAIKALSAASKMAGIWLNTGEGGLSKYHLEGGANLIFQIGTAKYGVRNKAGAYDEEKLKKIASYSQVKMFEIKLSQGAKPGKGGILPGIKVTEEVAEIRGIHIGEDSISPNRHPEINKVEDLLDMIHYIRTITEKPVGFKMALSSFDFFEQLCHHINERGIESAPDYIVIDGAEGGTGAAPSSLLDAVGLSIKEVLPIVVNIIKKHKLNDRIKIVASGKLITPAEIAWALCTGANFVNSARGFMFALGCIQSLKCNQDTCPTGITTHNKNLQRGLNPEIKSIRVAAYAHNVEKELEIIAHSCGVKEPRQLGREHARIVTAAGNSISMEELYRKHTHLD